MKRNIIVIAYFLLATIFLLLRATQGFSFLDIGMYMSGYTYFNDDPVTVYYLGQWLMSYELTGWLMKVFSIDTYFGLRVLRVILVICLEIILYLYLRRFIPRKFLLLGLGLVTLSQQGSYSEINYNDYSAFLLCMAILLYHKATVASRRGYLFYAISGLVVGVSIFFRMTNLSFLILPFCAVALLSIFGYRHPSYRSMIPFFSGVVTGVILMLALIYTTGMWHTLEMTVKDIFSIGTRSDDPHNIKSVFIWLYDIYKHEIQAGAIVLFVTLVYASLRQKFTRKAFRLLLLIVYIFLIWLNIYLREEIPNVTVGFSWLVMLMILISPSFRRGPIDLFAITFLFSLLLPIGTNGGSIFIGQDLAFLPLPVALYIVSLGLKSIKVPFIRDFQSLSLIVLSAIVFVFLYTDVKRPMSEEGNRLECRYNIDSPLTRNIYTTKENVTVLNHLIYSLKGKYLNGDYLFCNFNIPIVSLLDCKPYAVFSTVFCSAHMSEHYMQVAEQHLENLPYLLLEKDNMSERDTELYEYLKSRSKYNLIWTDGRFLLFKPENYHK